MGAWIDTLFAYIAQLGYWGIFIGLLVEVIPSEIVLSYAGYLVSTGDISFWGAVVVATTGGVFAQLFLYWLGKYGGMPFLEKYGKFFLLHPAQLASAQQWFARYGTVIVFGARFIPIVRHAISIPAGMAHMPILTFTGLTTLAIVPWSIGFVALGRALGGNWGEIERVIAPYLPYVVGGVVLLLAAYVFFQNRFRQEKGRVHSRQAS